MIPVYLLWLQLKCLSEDFVNIHLDVAEVETVEIFANFQSRN